MTIIQALMNLRGPILLIVHLMIVPVSNYLAFWLRFDGDIPLEFQLRFVQVLPLLLATRGAAILLLRVHRGVWRYASVSDLWSIVAAITLSSVAFFLAVRVLMGLTYPRSVFIIDALLLVILLGGLRMGRRIHRAILGGAKGKRILIFGAGDAGELIVRDMKNNPWYDYQPVGFIDDDAGKVGRRIHGVPVLGTRKNLADALRRSGADEILIAMPRAEPSEVRSIVRALEPLKIPIKTLPNLRDIIGGKVEVGQIRSLVVEDLLPRAPVGLDGAPLKTLIRGRKVLVTGAGGSIGSELCRQIAALQPSSLVLFERYENSLHEVRLELEDARHGIGLHPVVGDITDQTRVNEVLERFRPDLIFHAAAHKHVPLMEENPCEAVKNNVRGTRLLAQAADRYGVDRFILISTDKAVNPTSVMGASKRLAELVVQAQAVGSGTSYSVVRFGNVLASNGSVVPRFLRQIREGGPVTVTHPEMRRFFMLIPEAVQLVLHAAAQAEAGSVYVLQMGEQVKVADMARDLIRLSGLVSDVDIKLEFTGLRPGEKLFEELVGPDETVRPSSVSSILCVTARTRPDDRLWAQVDAVEVSAAEGRTAETLAGLRRIIPEYGSGAPAPAPIPDQAAEEARPRPIFAEQPCPRCAHPLHRSRCRNLVDRMRRQLSIQRPFRCDDCGWRGWLVPMVLNYDPASVDERRLPDLSSLDVVPAAGNTHPRPPFSPRNLQ